MYSFCAWIILQHLKLEVFEAIFYHCLEPTWIAFRCRGGFSRPRSFRPIVARNRRNDPGHPAPQCIWISWDKLVPQKNNTKYVKIKATVRVKSVQAYKSCFDISFKVIKVSNNTKMISELAPLGSPSPTAFRGLPHLKMSVAFATLKIFKPFLYLASNESSWIFKNPMSSPSKTCRNISSTSSSSAAPRISNN